ncbi:MAG: rhodanese-like domain-containing protein [Nitrospirales bacterium]|nr:sulfurtransferase [Nitrospirales bacterium]
MRHNPGFVQLVHEVRKNIRECSVETLKNRLAQSSSVIVLDVREDHEVQRGMIPGSIHLGRGILERDIETKIPDKQTEIILYCGGGYRSALAAENLQKMGYRNVWSLDGGIKAWTAAGYPLSAEELRSTKNR